MKGQQLATEVPSNQRQPEELKRLYRTVLLNRYGPFIGARINWWRLILGLLIVGLFLVEFATIYWGRKEVGDLRAELALTKKALSVKASASNSQVGNSTVTDNNAPANGLSPEDATAISTIIDDRLSPFRSQIEQALNQSASANETVQTMLNNPPFAVAGKDAMIFTSKRFKVFDDRVSRLEAAIFQQPSAATDSSMESGTQ